MKTTITVLTLSILIFTSGYISSNSKSDNNLNTISARDTIINPNVKVFRNVAIYEFFNSNSLSSVDLYNGLTVEANAVLRDVELADSTGLGRDRFYIRSGDGNQDIVPGQETRFVPQFSTRGINYTQAQFDSLQKINVGHADPLVPSDFIRWSTYSLGRSFVSSDIRVYGFWLKGKKISLGLPYEVYGMIYLKSIETVNIGGNPTYKLTLDIKINTRGENDFRETIVGIQPVSSEVVSDYSLHQNYPNPFNPATKIRFELPQSGFTKLTIFDSNGREIDFLIKEQLIAGTYELNWDASKFPTGIYFYKLVVNGFVQTRKMLLVK